MSSGFVTLQKLLPKPLISRFMGWLAASEWTWVKGPFIAIFMRAYNISLQEAERDSAAQYLSFNDFFTRALAEGVRPLEGGENILISPVDGYVSELGAIENGKLMQAKGVYYSAADLLGDSELADSFVGGSFITLYLAPANYHRIHAPSNGVLKRTIALPGELFSVNATTATHLPNLFARNERLTCVYESDQGPAAIDFVGALIVASIETVWPDATSPYHKIEHREHVWPFEQGDEMGRFLLGSTVVLCLPKGVEFDPGLTPGSEVRMGMRMGWFAREKTA